MRLYCENEIPMSEALFWEHIHDPRYEEMVGTACKLKDYSTIEKEDQPDAVYRKINVVPIIPKQFEALIKKVAKGMDGSYIEEQWRSKTEKVVRWKISLGFLGDRCKFEGIVRIEPIDENRCNRVLDGDVSVKVMGLGKILEKTIVSQTVDAYSKSAGAAKDYVAKYL